MAKVYLSAAAHAIDNPTKCPGKCGENVHCAEYMDIVEKRLKELGFEVMRTHKDKTGDKAMKARVKDANKWGADVYYVAHTNAGGGSYSLTMCHPTEESKKLANVFHKYRKCLPEHKVTTRKDLYEINATNMPCIYDELFFHDRATDCAWFHKEGMKPMAEEAVRALCEICGVKYVATTAKKPAETKTEKPAKATPKAGDSVKLSKGKLYISSTGKTHVKRTGTFYLYDGKKVNGRYRVVSKKAHINKKPLLLYVSGWVEL